MIRYGNGNISRQLQQNKEPASRNSSEPKSQEPKSQQAPNQWASA